jgi:UDP-hydrolysing UDP-N-acetyl-D-glucosamine 2-epimerase
MVYNSPCEDRKENALKDKRKICFFTGKRGGFNHFIPMLECIEDSPGLQYEIIASDMHLSEQFGNTIDEVREHAGSVHVVETLMQSDSKVARAKSIGLGILGFPDLLAELSPDIVFLLGDRGEVLGMAIAALELNIPIAHIFGGDVSQGGVDEPVRHAITKLSNIHFASNEESAERIIKMGEEPWRVHNVGSPVLDLIRLKRFTSPEETAERFGLDLDRPVVILLQHSVTWQVEEAGEQMRQTMEALDSLGHQTVAVYPCSDPGAQAVIDMLESFADKAWLQVHRNIDVHEFWGLMNVASVFVGNSSAGLLETPSFRLPCVNIGIRQEGRVRSDNVIDVGHEAEEIASTVERALGDREFLDKVENCVSPFGDGRAAERIVKVLEETPLDERLLMKRMTY